MWPPALKRSIDAAATAATPSPLLTHNRDVASTKNTSTSTRTSTRNASTSTLELYSSSTRVCVQVPSTTTLTHTHEQYKQTRMCNVHTNTPTQSTRGFAWLVSWSLTSFFSTNMAISERGGELSLHTRGRPAIY